MQLHAYFEDTPEAWTQVYNCLHCQLQEVVYTDISERDNTTAPRCDIYVSGAPCPAFSAAGKGGGLSDARGCVLIHSVAYVLAQRPRVAVFENVKGLINAKNRPVLDAVVEILKLAGYTCRAKVLDNSTHGALPHNRPRIYLVAILKSRLQKKFEFPEELPCPPLRRFLFTQGQQHTHLSAFTEKSVEGSWEIARKKFDKAEYAKGKGILICDGQASQKFLSVMLDKSPCLTKARAGSHGHYIMSLDRWMNLTEIAGLQGWPKAVVDELSQCFTRSEIGSTFGDGFCLSIVMRLLPRALMSAGLIDDFLDRWEHVPNRGRMPDAVYHDQTTHERLAVWK